MGNVLCKYYKPRQVFLWLLITVKLFMKRISSRTDHFQNETTANQFALHCISTHFRWELLYLRINKKK